jgi:hypothetical protein
MGVCCEGNCMHVLWLRQLPEVNFRRRYKRCNPENNAFILRRVNKILGIHALIQRQTSRRTF